MRRRRREPAPPPLTTRQKAEAWRRAAKLLERSLLRGSVTVEPPDDEFDAGIMRHIIASVIPFLENKARIIENRRPKPHQ